jgi:hypothetical protein
MFAKLRNSLHTINKYIKDPTTLATKSTGRKEGRKEGGGFPFQNKVQLGFGGL